VTKITRQTAYQHGTVQCWVRKINLRATEQSEKFQVRWGIHRSSVSWIIHKDLCLKCCKKRRAEQLSVLRLCLLLDKFSDTDSNFIFLSKTALAVTHRWAYYA